MPPCARFIPYPFDTTIQDIEFSIPRGKIAPFLPKIPPKLTPRDEKASSLPRNSMTAHTTNQLYS